MADATMDNVLVTGGCGFIGYNLVAKILSEEPTCKISVIDLPTSLPRYPSVTYYEVDISDKAAVEDAVQKIRPKVIFDAACTYSLLLPAEIHEKINHQGTLNTLSAAKSLGGGVVKAFIFHGSSSVVEDGYSDLLNADETKPVLFSPAQKFPYPLSKARAEKAVLESNKQNGMLTVSMRPAGTFGEADMEMMEALLGTAKSGRAKMQLGDGKNVYDFLYVGNYVIAHVLAARALLAASAKYEAGESIKDDEKVDGEVFHVTNDDSWLFWEFTRAVAKEAGFEVKEGEVKVIPKWMGLLIAVVGEWVVWISSLGKRESGLSRHGVRYSTLNRTLNITKVKKRLGYKPQFTMEEGIKRSVGWFRENGLL